MNLERFNTLVKAIITEVESTKFFKSFDQVLSASDQRVSNVGDANLATAAEASLAQFQKRLREAKINELAPTFHLYAAEYNLANFLGAPLARAIDAIIAENATKPAVVRDLLRKLRDSLHQDFEALKQASAAFDRFKVAPERPAPGTAELGVLVPRNQKGTVKEFGGELIELARIALVFQELATGSRDDPKITTISSTDLSIFMLLDIETARRIAEVISLLADGLKNLINIKRNLDELRKTVLSKDTLAAVEKDAAEFMSTKIEEVTDEVMRDANGNIREERRRELKIEVKGAITKIAIKKDKGYFFEVKAEPPASTGEDSERIAKLANDVAAIVAMQKDSQFLKDSSVPLLSITDTTEDESKK
jgi:hypothetical protein